jgi:competence protein ComEA
VRASTWSALVARGFLVGLGLVVLAWIGRSAAANARSPFLGTASITQASADSSSTVAATAAFPSLFADGGLPPPSPPPAQSASSAPAAPAPSSSSSSARATPDAPVYINHASVEELRRLPGVGAKRAEAILALRQRLGRFHRVEDLMRVKGVGRTTLKKWRPLVRLDAPPTAASADGGASSAPASGG